MGEEQNQSTPPGKTRGVRASDLIRGLENTDLTTESGWSVEAARLEEFHEAERVARERQQREFERTLFETLDAAAEKAWREERATWATIEVPERLQALERAAEAEAERLEQRHRQVVRLMRWTLFASALAVLVSIGALLVAWLLGGSP